MYSIGQYQDVNVEFLTVNLPESPNDHHVLPSVRLDKTILNQAHTVLFQAQHITRQPGVKFCRNHSKAGTPKQEIVKILHIPLEGSAENRGFLTDVTLRHSIFIDNVPDSDELGVYMLCESQDRNSLPHDVPAGIGERDRSRIIKRGNKKLRTHDVIANCVVKYMLFLGSVSDILSQSVDINGVVVHPIFRVYKRRAYPYNVVLMTKDADDSSLDSFDLQSIGLSFNQESSQLVVFWIANEKVRTVVLKDKDISSSAAVEMINKIKSGTTELINNHAFIGTIREVVPSLPLEADHSSSERGPYLGPSLTAMLKSPTVLFSEKIDMSIAFFEYIASEYDRYPTMTGFFDIKPDNFSYNRSTKTCDQNDKKARVNNGFRTGKYLMPSWKRGDSVASRDLWAMGQSLREIVESSDDKKEYDAFALTKIWTDIQRTARLTKEVSTFDNATYIKETVLPALNDIKTKKSFSSEEKLSISAENYLKDTLKDPYFTLPANEANKAVFTCAVLGAKAYLDQHQRKDSSSKGKAKVEAFLQTISQLSPNLGADQYRQQVTNAINEAAPKKSCLSPRFFSSSSRQALFSAYCSPVAQNGQTFTPEQYLRALTRKRLGKLLPNVTENDLNLAVDVFLGGESDSLRFQVLQKSVEYLECSKSGWLGRRAVKKLARSVCEAEKITDAFVRSEVELSIQNLGLFKYCSSKRRQEFFTPLLRVQ